MWEYKTEYFRPASVKQSLDITLKQLGDEGWELVNFSWYESDSGWLFIFKRRKRGGCVFE